jgi:hypothetical protein
MRTTITQKNFFNRGDIVEIVNEPNNRESRIGQRAVIERKGHAGFYWIKLNDKIELAWRAAFLRKVN